MKILVIAPTPYFSDRGCHIRIAGELEALTAAGHEAVVFTYHLGRDFGPAKIIRTWRVPWYHKTTAGPSWHKLYLDLLLFIKILWSTRRDRYDLIHAHLHEGVAIGWLIARLRHWPLLADIQSELTAELSLYHWLPSKLQPLVRRFQGWLLGRADWMLVSSPRALQLLQSLYPNIRTKMELVLDGVTALASNTATITHHDTPVIVYAGGMGQTKGVALLLTALEQLAQLRLPFLVLLIGRPNAALRQRVQTSVLQARTKIIEHVPYEKIGRVLEQADIGVDPKLPSSTESSGKILQYMAAGLATVAFASPTTTQLIGEAGYCIPEATAEQLANTLAEILRQPERRRTAGQAAVVRIHDHFMWKKLFLPVLQRYATLVESAHS